MHYLGSGQLLHHYCDKCKLNAYQIKHIFVGKTLRSFFIFLLSTVLFSSVVIRWMHKTSHCFPNMSGLSHFYAFEEVFPPCWKVTLFFHLVHVLLRFNLVVSFTPISTPSPSSVLLYHSVGTPIIFTTL